jgi:hypothetical protein
MALSVFVLTLLAAAPSRAGTAPVDVAPSVEKTTQQKWPRAAWSAEAKVWLVVWREGGIAGEGSDIWCARISAEGKALDPAGILVCKAKDVQSYPVAASDGKDFLVTWMDFRSGKDWDVYAARVTGGGKVLDADGFLVAGGAHNQCRPDAIFAGGNYLVAWQAFVPDALGKGIDGKGYGSYDIWNARVSTEGKVLDAGGIRLVPFTATRPSLALDGSGSLWMACAGRSGGRQGDSWTAHQAVGLPGIQKIDAATGSPQGGATFPGKIFGLPDQEFPQGFISPVASWISLAWLKEGGLLATRGYRGGCSVLRLDKDGRHSDIRKMLRFHNYKWDETVITPFSLASDGECVLLTMDWPQPVKSGEPVRFGVYGWLLSAEGPEGKVLDGGANGFPIAVEAGRDHMLATACGGPKATFLVVYSEPRAIDDTKVLARLVKVK